MENRPWNPLVLLIASWLVFALSGLLTTVCAGDWKFLFAGFMLASGWYSLHVLRHFRDDY